MLSKIFSLPLVTQKSARLSEIVIYFNFIKFFIKKMLHKLLVMTRKSSHVRLFNIKTAPPAESNFAAMFGAEPTIARENLKFIKSN